MNAGGTAGRLLVDLAVLAAAGRLRRARARLRLPASPTPTSMPLAAVATLTPRRPRRPSRPRRRSFGPVTVVTGTATCPTHGPRTVTTDPDGVEHFRNGTVKCTTRPTIRASAAPTLTTTWNADCVGDADLSRGELVQWATVRLENDGGAWEGRLSGVASLPGRGDIITIWYKGTGGYAGLSLLRAAHGSGALEDPGPDLPGRPPDLRTRRTGHPIVRPEAGGPVADEAVAVVTRRRDMPRHDFGTRRPTSTARSTSGMTTKPNRCTVTTDDPRVTGLRTSSWNFDVWGNRDAGTGAGVQWGTPRLENDRGAWEGTRHGRRLPARTRGHHRELVHGDRRLRGAGLLRAVDRKRALEDPGSDLPRRPPGDVWDGAAR